MRHLLVIPIIALLSACGVDGDPVKPSVNTGISINSHGKITPRTSISINKGPISIGTGHSW